MLAKIILLVFIVLVIFVLMVIIGTIGMIEQRINDIVNILDVHREEIIDLQDHSNRTSDDL